MSEYVIAVILCFSCAIYAGIKSGKRQEDIKTMNDLVERINDLRFKNDELLMDNQILANKVKRLENSNAQLQRRPRS